MIRHILALVLVAAFVNVYISKTVHEVFEHEHSAHACENQDLDHYHESEVTHEDLICSFNFSSTEITSGARVLSGVLLFGEIEGQLLLLENYRNVYLENNLLRGPPVLNS